MHLMPNVGKSTLMLESGGCNLQYTNLLWLQSSFPWIKFVAYSSDCHIIGTYCDSHHRRPFNRAGGSLVMAHAFLTINSFFSKWNLHVVFTRSIPINFPVCRPTGELNLSR